MSWSFHCKGSPAKVREAAAVHLPQAKNVVAHIPQELKMVEACEAAVASAVQHAEDNGADFISVEAYGSAFVKNEWNKHGGLSATINILVGMAPVDK